MSKEAMKSEMVDDEGENQAVRMFLAMYGGQYGITIKQMFSHLKMAGFDGAWPEWANSEMHLTKAGAQLWIRHLFALAEPAPVQQEPNWSGQIGRLIEAANHAASKGFVSGTTNWAATVARFMMANAPQPAQRKPLTDSEIYKAINDWIGDIDPEGEPSALDIFRAAEAAHGIKDQP